MHFDKKRLAEYLSQVTAEKVVGLSGLSILCAASFLAFLPTTGQAAVTALIAYLSGLGLNVLAGVLQQSYQNLLLQTSEDEQSRLITLARSLSVDIRREAQLRQQIGRYLNSLNAFQIAEEVVKGNPAVHGWLLVQIHADVTKYGADFEQIHKALAEMKTLIQQITKQDEQEHTTSISSNLAIYRQHALNHAISVIEHKSRMLKRDGELPKLQPLFVSFHDKNVHYRFSQKGNLEPEHKLPPSMHLIDAVKRDQCILLLGDLGTGKSTMAGLLIEEIITTNPKAIALLVPASTDSLKVSARATAQDVLDGVSTYFNNHISIRTPPIEISTFLDMAIPVYIVIDGLDEIPTGQASRLLSLLYESSGHYPNLWVITTGRPVELQGVIYQNWQIITTIPLQDQEKLLILQAESVANGLSEKEAYKQAKQLLERLKNIPVLDSLAVTPLTTRLLHSRLLTAQLDPSVTLGDLLYDLLQERMARWAQKDQKASALQVFESQFPDEFARITLFGEFALQFEMVDNLSVGQANMFLRDLVQKKVPGNIFILAKEALEFLTQAGVLLTEDNQVRFAIQPLFEFLAGYGLAEVWKSAGRTPAWLELQHWRVVSFAATTTRRLGFTNEFRSYLLDYLDQLLTTQRNIPAACSIISELQDQECAVAFVDHMSQMGNRPLTYFGDEKEQSTRAIAITIKLAGRKGFDWFYEHYLDPRYPLTHAASGFSDDLFEQWAYISQNHLSDDERDKLRKLVRPHIIASTQQTHSFIPVLAILMPEAFELKEALWFSSKYLGKGLFSTQAEAYFIREFNQGNKQLVNNVLLQIANKGYENAKSAAWLWLHLNRTERPHVLILKTLLSAYGRSYLDVSRQEYLGLCIARIGKKHWHQFLRWSLFDRKERVAAGAAIELYKLGERRLSILGEPLLRAMHDGGYFKPAEETLHQIIKELGPDGVTWLANQIAATANEWEGAHSGWWRIFLSELLSIGSGGPNLLAKCTGGVGAYLLPRYPEVRLLFRDLFAGANGIEYRSSLEESLYHIDPAVRHGAAMILVICYPQDEPLALETVVKLRHRESFGSWHEWESFCLSLSFSLHVLSHLKMVLPSLAASTKIFALMLLHRNGVELSPTEFNELVAGLLEVGNGALDAYASAVSAFANPLSYPILVSAVNRGPNSVAAARELLQHHLEKLSLSLQVKCISLSVTTTPWPWYPSLHEQVKKLESDPTYSEVVATTMAELANSDRPIPLLGLLREAVADDANWERVVWRLLCDDSDFGFSLEDNGQWLLDFGRVEPKYRTAIGTAAQKFLADPRVQDSRRGEIKQWLAILADEFVGISQDGLRNALLTQEQPAWRATTSALIARLDGEVPEQINIRKGTGSVPEPLDEHERPSLTKRELFRRLEETLRPSEELHPETCGLIEELSITPSQAEDSFTFSGEGVNGILILSALAYIDGRSPNPAFVIPILTARLTALQRNNHCFNHLLDIWRYGHWLAIDEDEELRKAHIEVLREKLSKVSDTFDTFAIGAELLRLRSRLMVEELEQILTPYVRYIEHHDFGLSQELLNLFASDYQPELQIQFIDVLEQAVEALDVHSWEPKPKAATRFLILSLAFWKLTKQNTTVSNKVFLRGLKAAYSLPSGNTHSRGPIEILNQLAPLFSVVPKENIKQAISYGATLSDPVIKNLCQLFILT